MIPDSVILCPIMRQIDVYPSYAGDYDTLEIFIEISPPISDIAISGLCAALSQSPASGRDPENHEVRRYPASAAHVTDNDEYSTTLQVVPNMGWTDQIGINEPVATAKRVTDRLALLMNPNNRPSKVVTVHDAVPLAKSND